MQQESNFTVDDNEALIDWQKVFSEDVIFSDSENDFFPEAVSFLERKTTSKDCKIGIFPLNRDNTSKSDVLFCTQMRPGQSCNKKVLNEMQYSIEQAISSPDSNISSCNRQMSKSSSSENCYRSHLNCKCAEMLQENDVFQHLEHKLFKTSKELYRASLPENMLIIKEENVRPGSICFNNLDILKTQCESASEMSISSQDSSNSQAMASQISSTDGMAVSSQESIERPSSEKMNISQETEAMVVSSQEILAQSSVYEKMNISQERENPITNILEQENCHKPENIRVKEGQCSFLRTNLSKTLSRNTHRILQLGDFNKMELLKRATSYINICSPKKNQSRRKNRYSSIARRELRVAKREKAVRIHRKLLAIREANLLRREKILEAKEKKLFMRKSI